MSWRDRGPAARATVKMLWFFFVVVVGSAAALTAAGVIAVLHARWPEATYWGLGTVGVLAILGLMWANVYDWELQNDRFNKTL